MNKINIVAEIGINHNGDLNIAKKLIDISVVAGIDYVKFQKRNPELCVPEKQKSEIRHTPWGDMSYIDYRNRIEFNEFQYREINKYCDERKIKWFASVWDKDSVDFMKKICPHDIMKIPSPLMTNIDLIKYARGKCKTLLISTGMSTEEEVVAAINEGNPDVIFHTNSSYPCKIENLKLGYITWLKNIYPDKEIGYSGHEEKLFTTFATVPLGVSWVERHITLDKNLWGSDQKSSLEIRDLIHLVKGIRDIESSLTGNASRIIGKEEMDKKKSLKK